MTGVRRTCAVMRRPASWISLRWIIFAVPEIVAPSPGPAQNLLSWTDNVTGRDRGGRPRTITPLAPGIDQLVRTSPHFDGSSYAVEKAQGSVQKILQQRGMILTSRQL